MIDHKLKFVFLHIPRTGGNSIKSTLGIKGHLHQRASAFDRDIIRNYFSFSFTRNPWDRFVSCYFYLKAGGMNEKYDARDREKFLDKYSSFEGFVRNVDFCELFDQQHFKPQSEYLDRELSFIGRFEKIDRDFGDVCRKIGVSGGRLPKKNSSRRQSYRGYYNSRTKSIIAEKYKDDIERFCYSF